MGDNLAAASADLDRAGAPWRAVLLLYGFGVLAAAAFGKIGPISVQLQAELGMSLGQVGWALSVVNAVTAVFGMTAGYGVNRAGPRRALIGGLAVMGLAGIGGAVVRDVTFLLVTRVIEGVGYLLVVVAAPTLIARMTTGRQRLTALALWGTFVPIGLALSSAAGGLVAADGQWRLWLMVAAVALLVAAGTAVVVGSTTGPGVPAEVPRHEVSGGSARFGRAALLAFGFGTVTLLTVAVIGLFPTFLTEARGVSTAAAGSLTAMVSLAAVPGGLLAGWLLRRGVSGRWLLTSAVLMPLGGLVAFVVGDTVSVITFGAALMGLANGLLASVVFTAVPAVAASPADVDMVNGLVAQLGALGSLVGPPLFTAFVGAGRWSSAPVLITFWIFLGTVALWLANGRRRVAKQG
jgi:MFS family permease